MTKSKKKKDEPRTSPQIELSFPPLVASNTCLVSTITICLAIQCQLLVRQKERKLLGNEGEVEEGGGVSMWLAEQRVLNQLSCLNVSKDSVKDHPNRGGSTVVRFMWKTGWRLGCKGPRVFLWLLSSERDSQDGDDLEAPALVSPGAASATKKGKRPTREDSSKSTVASSLALFSLSYVRGEYESRARPADEDRAKPAKEAKGSSALTRLFGPTVATHTRLDWHPSVNPRLLDVLADCMELNEDGKTVDLAPNFYSALLPQLTELLTPAADALNEFLRRGGTIPSISRQRLEQTMLLSAADKSAPPVGLRKVSLAMLSVPVRVTSNPADLAAWLNDQVTEARAAGKGPLALGFDTEKSPFSPPRAPPDLIQLATRNSILLFHSAHSKERVPRALRDVIRSADVALVGSDLRCDADWLGVPITNARDVSTLRDNNVVGIVLQTAKYLGLFFEKSRGITCSQWSANELTDAQIEYAALDAVLPLMVYERLAKDGVSVGMWTIGKASNQAKGPGATVPGNVDDAAGGVVAEDEGEDVASASAGVAAAAEAGRRHGRRVAWRRPAPRRGHPLRAEALVAEAPLEAPTSER
eukprot:CAMPEP_0170750294 /NCGR_PEP_ID=MMETSP0437-20130122/10853_1 /TAXON_ID=0 /ORGANISM="Sexangularia sp." /LENGTH=585 /DNA_ID=CAMNT_0011089277 /DNA_START=32 /DNA_END=1790 /DNA_ORIENTATION=+